MPPNLRSEGHEARHVLTLGWAVGHCWAMDHFEVGIDTGRVNPGVWQVKMGLMGTGRGLINLIFRTRALP
jgi:hypothetical protein